MSLFHAWEANKKEIRLRSGGTLTLACSDLFKLAPEDRAFVLELLAEFEAYEANQRGIYGEAAP